MPHFSSPLLPLLMTDFSALLGDRLPGLPDEVRDYVLDILAEGEWDDAEELEGEVGELLASGAEENSRQAEISQLCHLIVQAKLGERPAVQDGRQTGQSGPALLPVPLQAVDRQEETDSEVVLAKQEVAMIKERKEKGKKAAQGKRYHSEELTVSQGVARQDRLQSAERDQDIHLINVYICYGERVLLRDTTLDIRSGRRYGLVGR